VRNFTFTEALETATKLISKQIKQRQALEKCIARLLGGVKLRMHPRRCSYDLFFVDNAPLTLMISDKAQMWPIYRTCASKYTQTREA